MPTGNAAMAEPSAVDRFTLEGAARRVDPEGSSDIRVERLRPTALTSPYRPESDFHLCCIAVLKRALNIRPTAAPGGAF
jgi:hypothetical protein